MKYLSFSDAKGDFIRIGIELATNAQRDTFAENPMKVRFEIGIQKRCDIQFDLVQFFYSYNGHACIILYWKIFRETKLCTSS